MAADTNGWLDLFSGLPPQLQGAVTFAVAMAVLVVTYRKFRSRLFGNEPTSTDFAVGDPTSFADMTPLRNLVKSVDLLTQQMMESDKKQDLVVLQMVKNEAAKIAETAALNRLTDLIGQLLIDMREQREEQELEDARQRGYDEGVRSRTPSRRPVSKKTPVVRG